MVDSANMLKGLEIFAVGFGGVFVILILVALATASLSWLLPKEDKSSPHP